MSDPRILKLAKNLVNYSCKVKEGEKVMIEAFGIPTSWLRRWLARYMLPVAIPSYICVITPLCVLF